MFLIDIKYWDFITNKTSQDTSERKQHALTTLLRGRQSSSKFNFSNSVVSLCYCKKLLARFLLGCKLRCNLGIRVWFSTMEPRQCQEECNEITCAYEVSREGKRGVEAYKV